MFLYGMATHSDHAYFPASCRHIANLETGHGVPLFCELARIVPITVATVLLEMHCDAVR